MKNAWVMLNALQENLPMILAFLAVIFGIVLRVKKFITMSKEEKKAMLKGQSDKIVELVKMQLLAMVSEAENKWGSRTGEIKKSEVWEQILGKSEKLTQYIEMGLIDKKLIDDLIDEAVEEMQRILDRQKTEKKTDERKETT